MRLGAARVTAPQDLYDLGLGTLYNFTRVTGSRVNVTTGQQDGFAFSVAANYTFSKSTSNQTTSFTQHSQIPGVSQNAFTGTMYYERLGFSGRLSYS